MRHGAQGLVDAFVREVDALLAQGRVGEFQIVVGDFLRAVLFGFLFESARGVDRRRPFVLDDVDAKKRPKSVEVRVGNVGEHAVGFFRPIEKPRRHEVFRQGPNGLDPVLRRKVGVVHEGLVHADRAGKLPAAAKEASENEVQIRAFGLEAHRFDEAVDRLFLLSGQEQRHALRIGLRRLRHFRFVLTFFDAPADPAGRKKNGQQNEMPEFEIHGQNPLQRKRVILQERTSSSRRESPFASGAERSARAFFPKTLSYSLRQTSQRLCTPMKKSVFPEHSRLCKWTNRGEFAKVTPRQTSSDRGAVRKSSRPRGCPTTTAKGQTAEAQRPTGL